MRHAGVFEACTHACSQQEDFTPSTVGALCCPHSIVPEWRLLHTSQFPRRIAVRVLYGLTSVAEVMIAPIGPNPWTFRSNKTLTPRQLSCSLSWTLSSESISTVDQRFGVTVLVQSAGDTSRTCGIGLYVLETLHHASSASLMGTR